MSAARIQELLEANNRYLERARRAEAALSQSAQAHPDDLAVDRFAADMKAKLAKKRAEGRGGWKNQWEVSCAYLSLLLVEHVEKGDPLDVGNLAMMLQQRGERIADERERYAAKVHRDGSSTAPAAPDGDKGLAILHDAEGRN